PVLPAETGEPPGRDRGRSAAYRERRSGEERGVGDRGRLPAGAGAGGRWRSRFRPDTRRRPCRAWGFYVAVIYYSTTGTTHEMAKAAAYGAEKAGAQTRLWRVAEPAPGAAIRGAEGWAQHRGQGCGCACGGTGPRLPWVVPPVGAASRGPRPPGIGIRVNSPHNPYICLGYFGSSRRSRSRSPVHSATVGTPARRIVNRG